MKNNVLWEYQIVRPVLGYKFIAHQVLNRRRKSRHKTGRYLSFHTVISNYTKKVD